MATSSITANFKITDPKAARAFVDGLTATHPPRRRRRRSVRTVLLGREEIKDFFAGAVPAR